MPASALIDQELYSLPADRELLGLIWCEPGVLEVARMCVVYFVYEFYHDRC